MRARALAVAFLLGVLLARQEQGVLAVVTLDLNEYNVLRSVAPGANIQAFVCKDAGSWVAGGDCVGPAFSLDPLGEPRIKPRRDGVNACVHNRCFNPAGLVKAFEGNPDVLVQYDPAGKHFCANDRSIEEVAHTVGKALWHLLREDPPLPGSDPRIAGDVARWLPEVANALACDLPSGGAEQCMRGICGVVRRAAPEYGVNASAVTSKAGCHPIADDVVLSHWGTPSAGAVPPYDALGDLVLGRASQLPWHLDRGPDDAYLVMQHDGTPDPYTKQTGLAVASSYGIGPPDPSAPAVDDRLLDYPYLAALSCGVSAGSPCTWDSPTALFVPAEADAECDLLGEQLRSRTCNAAKCNGGGVCGIPTGLGAPCDVADLVLGPGPDQYALGRDALLGLVNGECLRAPPTCVRRATSLAGIPAPLRPLVEASALWAELSVAAPGQVPSNTETVIRTGLASLLDSRPFADVASAVCALPAVGGREPAHTTGRR
jgi:hypothetical protein